MTIEKYIEYWDQWIHEWYKIAPDNYSNEKIVKIKVPNDQNNCNWPLLDVPGGYNESIKEELSWKFFPEPYWGIPDSENLKGVFINFNPGQGGHLQHINTANNYVKSKSLNLNLACYKIWEKNPEISYYKAIKELYSDNEYMTTNWMKKKRESFIYNYNKNFNSIPEGEGDFVMFELCPWHTKSVTKEVYKYIKDNIFLMDKYIIEFAFETAKKIKKGSFKNIIITHGLDKKTVEDNKISLTFFDKEEIKNDIHGNPLKKCWKVDVFTKEDSNVKLLNFKNSSNGFPAMTKDLEKIIKKYSCN